MLLAARAAQGVGATLLLAGSLPVLVALVPGPGAGATMVGARRCGRGGDRSGARRSAHRTVLVAGDLPRPGTDRRRCVGRGRPTHERAVGRVPGRRRGPHDFRRARRDDRQRRIRARVRRTRRRAVPGRAAWRSRCGGTARPSPPLLVSALPLGMLLGRAVQPAPGAVVAIGGAVLLAARVASRWRSSRGPRRSSAAFAFAICGVGFDLVHEVLDGAAVPAGGPPVRAGAVIDRRTARRPRARPGADRAGAVVEPQAGIERATLGATQTMLLTDLPLFDKVPVTWALRTAIEEAPRGQVPDLAAEFDERGAEGDNEMARARDELMDTVTDAVTRSFRPAFVIAAALAALAALAAWFVVRRRPRPTGGGRPTRRKWSAVGLGAHRRRRPRPGRVEPVVEQCRHRRVRRRGSVHRGAGSSSRATASTRRCNGSRCRR